MNVTSGSEVTPMGIDVIIDLYILSYPIYPIQLGDGIESNTICGFTLIIILYHSTVTSIIIHC